MGYATPEQFLLRYDARVVGDLISDDGNRILPSAVGANPVLLSALEDASGQIRSACLTAKKYTETDLDTLTANQDSFLVKLTCSLAMGFLLTRRQRPLDSQPEVVEANQWLAMLRFGERILNVPENAEAGVLQTSTLSISTRANLGLVADASRFFPLRTRYGL